MIGRFLAGIAALIYHPPTSQYLFLRRAGHRDFGAGAWECVAGRVDQGESFEEALHREVQEEVKLSVTIDAILGTTHFYRGEPSPETELLGVMYACTVQDLGTFFPSEEHSEYCWLTAAEALAMLPEDSWLVRLIRRAELLRRSLPAEIAEHFRITGTAI